MLLPSEVGYSPRIGGRLPGVYQAGFFYSNADHADVLLDVDGGVRRLTGRPAMIRGHQWAVFGNVRQQITLPRADGSGGLSAFPQRHVGKQGNAHRREQVRRRSELLRAFAHQADRRDRLRDRDRTVERPTDGPAAQLNAVGLEAAPVRSAEYTAELYYGIDVRSGLVVRPNVQVTISPGGDPDRAPVAVLGLKVVTTL